MTMTNQTFNIGDVVQLKSGGPKMTITSMSANSKGEPTAWCEWFVGSDPKANIFNAAGLMHYVETRVKGII